MTPVGATAQQEIVDFLAGNVVGALNISRALVAFGEAGVSAIAIAFGVATVLIFLGTYVGWHSLADEEKFAFPRNLILIIATTGGTSFLNSHLTNADFSQATLKNIDLRANCIQGTIWSQVKGLNTARLGNSYLKHPLIRQLVTEKQGSNLKFDGFSLKGVNLSGAVLTGASFIEADLTEANFKHADLSQANLAGAFVDGTNFADATLTGACIENWGLTRNTILDGVKCKYIYMQRGEENSSSYRERKPDNHEEQFEEGDFHDFIQPIVETLDLFHRQDLDPRAMAIALNRLMKNHPEANIDVVAVERKGKKGEQVLMRAKTAASANLSSLHAEYFTDYEQLKSLPREELLKIISQQGDRIRDLENYININTWSSHETSQGLSPPLCRSASVKQVTLNLGNGNFQEGFPSILLRITEDNDERHLLVQEIGKLPAEPQLSQLYTEWRSLYRQIVYYPRLKKKKEQAENFSKTPKKDLQKVTGQFKNCFNRWLKDNSFRRIYELLLQKLSEDEEIQFVIEAQDNIARNIPWHLWEILAKYPQSELSFNLSAYEFPPEEKSLTPRKRIRILTIFGSNEGINLEVDRELFELLPDDAETISLKEPRRRELTKQLWDKSGWDILCFSGHSDSDLDGKTGKLNINKDESITIEEMKNGLKEAIKNGLQFAILNSCDGLGLARQLANLNIPQIIVMREPIPDEVAQEFLKNFLSNFSRGQSLDQAVRQARKQLEHFEDEYPWVTFLPTIYQNPTKPSKTWQDLLGVSNPELRKLIRQLEKLIRPETILSQDDRASALEKIQYLAEAEQNLRQPEVQQVARTSVFYLRGMLEELPPTAQFVRRGKSILSEIVNILNGIN